MSDFGHSDANHDGIVDRDEYLIDLQKLLAEQQVPKEQQDKYIEYMQYLYDSADMNGDGALSELEHGFTEFLLVEDAMARGTGMSKSESHRMKLDKNGDGVVSNDEFAQGWRGSLIYLGLNDAALSALEASPWTDAFFAQCDVNQDGELDARELQYASYLVGEFVVEHATDTLFEHLDVDGDGSIEEREIAARLRQHDGGGSRAARTVAIAHRAFPRGDLDGDGRISKQLEGKLFTAAVLSGLE